MATHVLTNNGTTRQGLFNWLGTEGGTTSFTNPVPSEVTLTQSSYFGSGYDGDKLTTRSPSIYISQVSATNGEWVTWDIGAGRTLKVSGVAIQQNGDPNTFWANYLWRNILVQASTDGSTWDTLANPTTTTGQYGWDDISFTQTTTAYRYLRLKQNGFAANGTEYYFCMGEVEWFGTYDDGLAPPEPTVTDITPAEGPYEGGTEVVITGTNFTGATNVSVGLPVESFTVDSSTQITAVVEHGAGPVNVTVETPEGTDTLVGGYTYINPAATGWTLTSGVLTVPLPVDATSEPEITYTRDQTQYQPLTRYAAVFDLGSAHGATIKTSLFFLSKAEEVAIRNAAFGGICTITSPYGDSWNVLFDGTWTVKIKNAFSAEQEAVRTVDVTWIEV